MIGCRPEGWLVWLGELEGDAGALLHPAGDDVLKAWPVGMRVKSPRNDAADLLELLELNSA